MINSYYHDLSILRGNTNIPSQRLIHLKNRDYWCLQYNHEGTISIKIDGQSPVEAKGPSLLITSPGHDYTFGNNEGWHHNYLAFTGDRVERYLKTGFIPQNSILTIREGHRFLAHFEDCLKSLQRQDRDDACYHFEGLLLQLHRESRPKKDASFQSEIHQLVKKMRDHPEIPTDLDAEAKRLHLSLVHLRRTFKKVTGQAAGQFQNDCRLAKAANQLTGTFLPIKQIAADCGLDNIHYFSRVFTRKYGLPPGKYRREFLGS